MGPASRPYRVNAALVAKQTATIHHLSGGRFAFGVAVGAREHDFEASGVSMRGFLGEYSQGIASSAATDAQTIEQYLEGFEAAGCDEAILFPCKPDVEQVDLLAEVALH